MALTKPEVKSYLEKLRMKMEEELSSKQYVIDQVKSNLPPGGEPEGVFTKTFLSTIIKSLFQDVTIEGIDSGGKTQFKHSFFGTKPAIDFVVEEPIKIIGEVKFDSLTTRNMATAIGQLLLYIFSSKNEIRQFEYGCLIFFDKSMKFNQLTENEIGFMMDMWNNNNIFIIII